MALADPAVKIGHHQHCNAPDMEYASALLVENRLNRSMDKPVHLVF